MREKELRIALVCFGGVSLAIYMHGITKEILKLARASAALHAIADRAKRLTSSFFDTRDRADPEYDTEAIYFDLLRDIGRTVDLRVIVDILAGASAGGINSVMLARALSHDLPMGRLRDLWLDNADVTELLAPEAKARRFSKWLLRPLFWVAGRAGPDHIGDPEVRAKLSLFMRSRWFQPPLGGAKMAALMYDAVNAMGAPRDAAASLLPHGLRLDLFVTVTDFYGGQLLMQIHDPPVIHEREHRHVLHFHYRRQANGAVDSDFDLANAPALAFAARATSSIPGAFPPARILEMDRLIDEREAGWPRRARFIAQNFEQYAQLNVDVASVPFVDGSVLNSRPFREAIAAIHGRPAYREVDRRVIYVDPNPALPGSPTHHVVPSFFATLKGALSDIPLTQPLTDELGWIARHNEGARRLKAIVDSAHPDISRLVSEVMTAERDDRSSEDRIQRWRDLANRRAAHEAGYAYEAYARLKLASARSFISELIVTIRGVRANSPFARAIAEIIDAWATAAGATYQPTDRRALPAEAAAASDATTNWVAFLLAFDVDYRKRRLHFLIEGVNRLYPELGTEGFADLEAAAIDRLKRGLYDRVETLERLVTATSLNETTRNLVEDIFQVGPSPAEVREIANYAQAFVARHKPRLARLIAHLAVEIDLQANTRDIDILLAKTEGLSAQRLHEVMVNYLGFPFWDTLTFPVIPWRQAGEFNEIRVDRISAQDAIAIERLGSFRLKGAALGQYAAFLSRPYRENDYLLGRLHAINRLIDIVCDAAGPGTPSQAARAALKKIALLRILDAEEPHLPTCKTMIAELRAALAVN